VSPRHGTRTVSCTPAQARARREHARAFLDVADTVLDQAPETAQPHVAAALAVLAAIAATDAICGLSLGRYSRGQDHGQAVSLLEIVDLQDPTLPAKLRRLLSAKDDACYSPRLMSRTDAQALVRQPTASSTLPSRADQPREKHTTVLDTQHRRPEPGALTIPTTESAAS
jgi:hypothetical protein